MKQWTTEQVAKWLDWTGLATDETKWPILTGLELANLLEDLPAEMVESLGVDLTSKLLQQIVLTQSTLGQDRHLDTAMEELTEALAKVTVEKERLAERLALYKVKLQDFEEKKQEVPLKTTGSLPDLQLEDRLLNMVHRHEEERRRMEERHQQETHHEEMEIRHHRKQQSPSTGKRHFPAQEVIIDQHRYY